MEERGGVYRGILRERNHLGDPGVDGRIILRWIFRKWDVRAWTGSRMAQDRNRWRALSEFYLLSVQVS
jgi:hypothetical protein